MGHTTSTFYVIDCPAAGSTLGAGSVDADGINLGQNSPQVWDYNSLWYVLPIGSSNASQPGQFRVVTFQSITETPAPNWVLICTMFTDAGQQVIRWQAGSVVLPLPDVGHQIQWGGNLQQLGRGANKIVLDGTAGSATIPGSLTIGGIAAQTTPFISLKVNATNPISTSHHRGRVYPNVFLLQTGQWKVTFDYPPGLDFVPHLTLCPPVGQTGFIAAWPHTLGNPTTSLFIYTCEVTGSPQTYSFYITIF
jgi:hypothetical protein